MVSNRTRRVLDQRSKLKKNLSRSTFPDIDETQKGKLDDEVEFHPGFSAIQIACSRCCSASMQLPSWEGERERAFEIL